MDEFNMLPIFRRGLGEISDGIDIMVPVFCRGRCEKNEKCRNHYEEMENKPVGVYQCPYGFSSYVFQVEDEKHIFTCLRVEGEYDSKLLLPKIKGEGRKYREITMDMLETYAEAYKEYLINQFRYEKYKRFVDDIFHDVRKFNQQIKIKNERLYRKSQAGRRYEEFLELSKSINVISWFLTLRLNNHDFLYNEELMGVDIPSFYNMHKIIHKVKMCIEDRAKEKGIRFNMTARCECRDMKAYDCIELLPFLILDNAIKYSPHNEEINISFEEKDNKQHIRFCSLGPVVKTDEVANICKQGYRGEEAIKITNDGMGIGLYTASCICKLNGIQMEVSSSQEMKKMVKNIAYSEFLVDFWINL